MENDFDSFYPEKPVLEEPTIKKRNVPFTFLSIFLFIATFLLFFDTSIIFVAEVVVVLLIHELGHFLMMKRYNYENVRMWFVPFMGAFVNGKKAIYHQRQSITVILAGPIPGILFGIICWILGQNLQQEWLIDGALLFFFLNMLNLLPLQPLDGGRLLATLFFQGFEWLQFLFTFLSSLIMIAIGVYFELYFLVIFGFIMGFQVRNAHRKYLIHKSLKENGIHFSCDYNSLSNKQFHQIREEVLAFSPNLSRINEMGDPEETIPIIASEVRNVLVPPMILNSSRLAILVTLFLWILGLVGPIVLIWNSKLQTFFNGI